MTEKQYSMVDKNGEVFDCLQSDTLDGVWLEIQENNTRMIENLIKMQKTNARTSIILAIGMIIISLAICICGASIIVHQINSDNYLMYETPQTFELNSDDDIYADKAYCC